VVKNVHVRYLISWWVSCNYYVSNSSLNSVERSIALLTLYARRVHLQQWRHCRHVVAAVHSSAAVDLTVDMLVRMMSYVDCWWSQAMQRLRRICVIHRALCATDWQCLHVSAQTNGTRGSSRICWLSFLSPRWQCALAVPRGGSSIHFPLCATGRRAISTQQTTQCHQDLSVGKTTSVDRPTTSYITTANWTCLLAAGWLLGRCMASQSTVTACSMSMHCSPSSSSSSSNENITLVFTSMFRSLGNS